MGWEILRFLTLSIFKDGSEMSLGNFKGERRGRWERGTRFLFGFNGPPRAERTEKYALQTVARE